MDTESIDDKLPNEFNKLEKRSQIYYTCGILISMAMGFGSLATGAYLTHDYFSRLERAHEQCVSDESTLLETSRSSLPCWEIDIIRENWFGRY